MNIAELLTKEAVLTDMTASGREEALQELVSSLLNLHPELTGHDLVNALCEREKLGSTAVGEGVALPHCKTPGLDRIYLAAGRSRKGVLFDLGVGAQLCHIFFLILAPEHEAGQHLRVLAQLARRAKDAVFRSEILLSKNRDEMWQVITTP